MLKIRIKNINTQLDGFIPTEAYQELFDNLAYFFKGAEFSEKYVSGQWDGFIRLYNSKKKTFPTGLLGLALEILEKHHILYTIEDLRRRPKITKSFQLKKEKDGEPFSPHKYQLDVVQKALIYGRGLIEIATGGGKSLIITMILAKLGLPSIVFVNTCDLLYQMIEDLQMIDTTEDIIGQMGDGIIDPKLITIATVQTMCQAMGVKYPKFDTEDSPIDTEVLPQEKKEIVLRTIQSAQAIAIDETQFLASDTFQLVSNNATNAYYRFGLSVGGDSIVHIRHENKQEIISLENLFKRTDLKIGEFRDLPNYEIRSFDGNNFVWKSIKGILKHHIGEKKAFRLQTGKNKSILVTEDHSVYKVVGHHPHWVNGKSWRERAQLEVAYGKDLKVGDYLLLENELKEPDLVIKNIEIIKYLKSSQWRVAGDFQTWIKANYPGPRARHLLYRAKHGPSIPLTDFNDYKLPIEKINHIFSHGEMKKIPLTIPVKSIAYLLGFYMGDGWTAPNKVSFALGLKDIDSFVNKLYNLQKIIPFNFFISKKPGKSVDLHICSTALYDLFYSITKNQKALTKRIPSEVFLFDNESVLEFIKGMIDSDGNTSKSHIFSKTYTTNSKYLAYDLYELLKRFGIVAGIYQRKKNEQGGIVNGKQIISKNPAYDVKFSHRWLSSNHCKKLMPFHFDMGTLQGLPVKIKKIQEDFPEYVYDISVDSKDWPCFIASGILVHNSATPVRSDNADILLNAVTGKKFFSKSASSLIEEGFLVAPDITMIHLPRKKDSIVQTSFPAIYKNKVTENEISNDTIVDIAKFFYERDMSVLILVQHILHGEILLAKLKTKIEEETVEETKTGRTVHRVKNIEFLKGKNVHGEKRKRIVALIKNKTIKILIATTLADCGLNIPSLDVLILGGRGNSLTRVPQRIGRVIRKAKKKTRAFIFDFYDHEKYLNPQAKERKRIYNTERAFYIHEFKLSEKNSLEQYLKNLILPRNAKK